MFRQATTTQPQMLDHLSMPKKMSESTKIQTHIDWNRNKSFIIKFSLLSVLSGLTFLWTLSISALVQMLGILSLLWLFCILCRDRKKYFDLFFTFYSAAFPLILFILEKKSIMRSWTCSVLAPVYIAVFTGKSSHIMLTTLLQLLLQRFFLLDPLQEHLIMKPLNEVVTDFLLECTIVMTLIMISLLLMNNFLRCAISQFSTQKQNELDTQKNFFLSVSHELRTPLNSLLGVLDLALLNSLPSQLEGLLKTGRLCGDLLLHLVNNILDTEKIESGELEVDPKPTSVLEAFENIWSITSELIRSKNLQGHCAISQSIPHVANIDEHRIAQIILNLVGNSVKFTEKGLIRISVNWIDDKNKVDDDCFFPLPYNEDEEAVFEKESSLYMITKKKSLSSSFSILDLTNKKVNPRQQAPRYHEKGVLKITISDTGSGISPEQMKKIFKRFSQLPSKRKIGSGLGLYITQELVRKMNGDIRAYSKPGKGSTFIICLPTTLCMRNTKTFRTFEEIQTITQAMNLRALVINAQRLDASIISTHLKTLKVNDIKTESDGNEAANYYEREALQGKPIDIVILDIDMKSADAYEIARNIREFERKENIKPCFLLVLTDNDSVEMKERYMSTKGHIKADDYLKKPLCFTQLIRSFSDYFSNV